MGSNGTLNINGGAVTAAGTGKNGVFVRGNFRMKGGSLTATGSRKPGIENEGTFELLGGTISTKSNSGGIGFCRAWICNDQSQRTEYGSIKHYWK